MKRALRFCEFCVVMLLASVSRSSAQPGWFWQNPRPQGNALYGVSVLNANTMIAVGDAGTVVKSTDGGAKWTVQSYEVGPVPVDIQ
jgi:hypothetical protein